MRVLFAALLGLVMGGAAMAQNSPYLVSPDGTYLGTLNSNPYDPDSVANPYGKYGSEYSPDSINNAFGKYGSPYSNYSAHNPFATQAPEVHAPCYGFNCE